MRSRRLAALLNLFFPGTGLLYAGRPIASLTTSFTVPLVAKIAGSLVAATGGVSVSVGL